ncbi:MAG: DUF1573 domain-containing protein [Paludibacteraceae bacterium]|nr:DUF1573 domain-containing protein [Parabacteroides sp.]MCI7008816.1 DUF1573 domain-containing protein [Parabacteroides sp.]MDY4149024.1 DUF1573 domain-containing protein [Paludibacteraceae bacterium]
MLNSHKILLLIVTLCCVTAVWADKGAQIVAKELTYNFGTIAEADGLASHVFTIQNTGDAPLVITRVTASCGCTRPEWSKAPIAPGQTSQIKVSYDPKGRPGPFYKTVSIYSNGKKGCYNLAIKGTVTPKPAKPVYVYPYAIGPLKLHTKQVLFSSIRQDETLGEKIQVKNESDSPVQIRLGKVPHYLLVQAAPETLASGEEGVITLLFDAKAVKRKGRATSEIPVTLAIPGKKEEIEGEIHVAANLIDNFSKLSASEKAQAPVAQLSGTLLEFGQLPDKQRGIPLIGGKVVGTFEITNTGKTPLQIYSVTCDDERIDISGGKKELKPGATATYKVALHPKTVKTKLETLINVVCNDPNGPIRLIKVTAYK